MSRNICHAAVRGAAQHKILKILKQMFLPHTKNTHYRLIDESDAACFSVSSVINGSGVTHYWMGVFQNVFDKEMECVYWPWAAVLHLVSDAAEYGGVMWICAVLDLVKIIHIHKHHANHIHSIAWLLQNKRVPVAFPAQVLLCGVCISLGGFSRSILIFKKFDLLYVFQPGWKDCWLRQQIIDYDSNLKINALGERDELSSFTGRKITSSVEVP